MKDFFLLLKAVQASSLTVNRKRRGKVVKPKSFSFSLLLVGFILALTYGSQLFNALSKLQSYHFETSNYFNALNLIFTSAALYGFFMCLVFSSSIYYRGNNDVFLSLPISGNRYFFAKLVLTSYLNLVYGGLTILTIGIMACVMLQFGFISYLMVVLNFLIYVLVTPCISFLIIDLFANFIDFKQSKTGTLIFSSICGVLASLSIMLGSVFTSAIPIESTQAKVLQSIDNYTSLFRWLTWSGFLQTKSIMMMNSKDALYFLIHFIIAACFIAISLLVSRRTYLSHLGKTYRSHKKSLSENQIQHKIEKSKSQLSHPKYILLKREWKIYRQDKTFLLDVFIFPITMTLSLGITLFSLSMTDAFSNYPNLMNGIILGAICLNAFYVSLPYASTSLEKKDLSLIKTLPMSMSTLSNIKLLPSLILFIPISVIASIVFLFAGNIDILFVIMVFILSVLYPSTIILFSFFMGVTLPNFNYSNSLELIKKGWGIGISNIGHAILSLVCTTIFIFFSLLNILWMGFVIVSILLLSLSIVFYILSKKKMKRLFESEITF